MSVLIPEVDIYTESLWLYEIL